MNLNKLNIKSLNSKLSHQMPDGSWMAGAKHMQEGGESDEESMYTEPEESIITKNKFDYKRVWDPKTDTTSYYTKPSSGKNWKDLQDGRNDRALTSVKATVFKDIPLEQWEQHKDKKDWDNQMGALYKKKIASEKENALADYKNTVGEERRAQLANSSTDFSNYGVKVVQYPYGRKYGSHVMPPGHIEAQLYYKSGPKKGKLVNEIDGGPAYVNRWSTTVNNAPLDSSHWTDKNGKKDPKVRIVDLDLSSEEVKNFLTEASTFGATDISELKKIDPELAAIAGRANTALGTGKKGAYDFTNSNCADGVCKALGLDDGAFINAGITDPTEVMDGILIDKRYKDKRHNISGKRTSPKDGVVAIVKDQLGYDLTGKSGKIISEYLDTWDEGTVEKIGIPAWNIYKNYLKHDKLYTERDKAFQTLKDNSSWTDATYYMGLAGDLANKGAYARDVLGDVTLAAILAPDGTIPTMLETAWEEKANKHIKANTPFDVSMDGVNNIVPWWEKKVGDGVERGVDYIEKNSDFQLDKEGLYNINDYWSKGGKGDAGVRSIGNSINSFFGGSSNWWKEGGQPKASNGNQGRYQDISSYGNFNQWNQNDASVRAPIQSAYMPMNLGARGNVTGAIATLGESAGRLFGGKDKDGDGLMDGAFRDNKAKRKRHQARRQLEKSQNYDYKVTADPNDTTKYVGSSTSLYNASKKRNPESLETIDDWKSKLTGDNTFANFDTKSNRYNVNYANPDFMSRSKKLRPSSINDLANLNKKLDPSQQSAVAQLAQDADAFNAADDIPKGTTFGVNADGQSVNYTPGAQTEQDKINYYNTMMMKKFGGHMQEGGQPSPEEMAMMQAQQEQQPQQAPQEQAPQQSEEDGVAQLMEEVKGALDSGAKPQEVMIQLLQAGMQPEAVAQVFVQLGMPEDQIGPAIEQAVTQVQNGEGAEPSEEEMMAAQQAQAGAPAPPMMQYGGPGMMGDGSGSENSFDIRDYEVTTKDVDPTKRNTKKIKSNRKVAERFAYGGTYIAQDGTETPNPDPRLEAAQQKYDAAVAAYGEKEAEAMAMRETFGNQARTSGDANASATESGMPSNTAKWIQGEYDKGDGWSCNAYSCSNMRKSEMLVPEGEDIVINGRTYSAGDVMPILPGNEQFNSYAERLGWELQPKGTRPTEVGDLGRGHMYSNAGAGDGSFHSYISAGYGDDEVLDIYNNSGNPERGYTRMSDNAPLAKGDEDYYTTDSGVMRWVGDMPKYKRLMIDANRELDAIQSGRDPQSEDELAVSYREWANSTPELAKKYGKTSRFDLDAAGSANKWFDKSYTSGAEDFFNRNKAQQGTEVMSNDDWFGSTTVGQKAQQGGDMDAAQFAAEENAAAAQQGYPEAQQMSQGDNRQMNPEDLLKEVVDALTQGAGPDQIYNKIIEMGVDQQMAGQIIQQAMSMMNQSDAPAEEAVEDDGYAQMLEQLQDQKNSFKNEYRRDVKQLNLKQKGGSSDSDVGPGGYGTMGEYNMLRESNPAEYEKWTQWAMNQMQNAKNPRPTPSGGSLLLSRDQLKGAFQKRIMTGMSPLMVQAELYNSGAVSEKDYSYVQGLVNQNRTLKKKKGGSTPIELTTQQIAQIMAAGGSVKYV